jgi:hypothetical protein
MTEPVVDPDGNTYERAAIEKWLARNPTSPMTRAPLTPGDLQPNRALADAIAILRPELNIEEALPAQAHPEVTRSLDEENALRAMWLGKVTVKVVRATALAKADAIVVVGNGSSHLGSLPEALDGPSCFKKATAPAAGTNPVWEKDITFPAALAASAAQSEEAQRPRELVFNVKHLAVGKTWTNNNEGEWLGKATVKLADIVASAEHGLQLTLPVTKKGVPQGSAHLELSCSSQMMPYESFVSEVSKETAAMAAMLPPTAQPKTDVRDVINMLGAGLKVVHGDLTGKPELELAHDLGTKLGMNARAAMGLKQEFSEADLAEQKRVYATTLASEGPSQALVAVVRLQQAQRERNLAAGRG